MGRGSSKVSGGSTAGGVAEQKATSKAITDFFTSYGRQSIQKVTSLGGVSGRIPTRKGGAVVFRLSENKLPNGDLSYHLQSDGRLYTFKRLSEIRQKLMELAGF